MTLFFIMSYSALFSSCLRFNPWEAKLNTEQYHKHACSVSVNSLWKAAWLWECLLLLYPFCPCEWEGGREGCCGWAGCEGCWEACCWGGGWVGVGGRGAWVMTWACGDADWRRPSPWPACSGSMAPEPDTGRRTEERIRPDFNFLTCVWELQLSAVYSSLFLSPYFQQHLNIKHEQLLPAHTTYSSVICPK